MAKADKVIIILLELSIKEWQRIKITNDMPSTDYPIPKDVPSMAIVKHPNPNANVF